MDTTKNILDIPTGDVEPVKAHAARYYSKMADEFDDDGIIPPWEKEKAMNEKMTMETEANEKAEEETPTEEKMHMDNLQPIMGDVLTGSVHRIFTALADGWIIAGYFGQDDRILLSKAIGNALETLNRDMPEGIKNMPVHPYDVFGYMAANKPLDEKQVEQMREHYKRTKEHLIEQGGDLAQLTAASILLNMAELTTIPGDATPEEISSILLNNAETMKANAIMLEKAGATLSARNVARTSAALDSIMSAAENLQELLTSAGFFDSVEDENDDDDEKSRSKAKSALQQVLDLVGAAIALDSEKTPLEAELITEDETTIDVAAQQEPDSSTVEEDDDPEDAAARFTPEQVAQLMAEVQSGEADLGLMPLS